MLLANTTSGCPVLAEHFGHSNCRTATVKSEAAGDQQQQKKKGSNADQHVKMLVLNSNPKARSHPNSETHQLRKHTAGSRSRTPPTAREAKKKLLDRLKTKKPRRTKLLQRDGEKTGATLSFT